MKYFAIWNPHTSGISSLALHFPLKGLEFKTAVNPFPSDFQYGVSFANPDQYLSTYKSMFSISLQL